MWFNATELDQTLEGRDRMVYAVNKFKFHGLSCFETLEKFFEFSYRFFSAFDASLWMFSFLVHLFILFSQWNVIKKLVSLFSFRFHLVELKLGSVLVTYFYFALVLDWLIP